MTARTGSTRALPSRGRKTAIVLWAIAVIAVAAAAAEIGLRLLGANSPVIDADMLLAHDDPLLPFVLHPGFRGSYSGGYATIAADGYRIVPLPASMVNADTLPRLVLLGDSVAFGQGLDDDKTIAAYMQSDAEWGTANRVVDVAVPSYTSWNEYAALRDLGKLSGVRTLLLIYVANDLTMDNDHFKLRTNGHIYYLENDAFHKATRFLYDRSRLFDVVSDRVKRMISDAGRRGRPPVGETDDGTPIDAKALAYSMEAVAKIRDICRSQNINFLVALYREGSFYTRPKWTAAYEATVSQQLAALGIDHFVLDEATARLDLDRYTVSWDDHRHASPAAARLIAAQIVAELRKRGF
jgi:hypothetical protein